MRSQFLILTIEFSLNGNIENVADLKKKVSKMAKTVQSILLLIWIIWQMQESYGNVAQRIAIFFYVCSE